eukprot:m.48361 g.48361  ORF g.48361 m.48361 type:complete len:303 (+) comp11035_c0_seq3:35-943(+)
MALTWQIMVSCAMVLALSHVNHVCAKDPMKEMMDLMEEMIDLMTNTTNEFADTSDHIIAAVANMSHRIVYTENLIDDEGLQIGVMANRIDHTEEVVGNLTTSCFCRNSSLFFGLVDENMKSKKTDGETPAQAVHEKRGSTSVIPPPHLRVSPPESKSDNPWDDMIETMHHAITLMEQIANNITNLTDIEVNGISTMANRIVDTECLIMDMSKQIGMMADRIVYTERLMYNASMVCCGEPPHSLSTVAPTTAIPTTNSNPPTTLEPDCKPYPYPNSTLAWASRQKMKDLVSGFSAVSRQVSVA